VFAALVSLLGESAQQIARFAKVSLKMIGSLQGVVGAVGEESALVEVGGVG
jgi:hypothetical protein